MSKLWLPIGLVAFTCTIPLFAQTPPASDPLAVSYAQQSIAALNGGTSVSDVSLSATVVDLDGESGTGTFTAKGPNQSRADLNSSSGSRSDVRNLTNEGFPRGAWQENGATVTAYSQHNCWIDAVWFYPGLSSLTQTANPAFVFKYIGKGSHNGSNVLHIQVFQTGSQNPRLTQLSKVDFYLDAVSFLPVASAFSLHPDNNLSISLPTEIDFTNYQTANGFQIPFHFQKVFNGVVILDATVTSAAVNTGLADSSFALQ